LEAVPKALKIKPNLQKLDLFINFLLIIIKQINMSDKNVKCPKCWTVINLDEIAQNQYEEQLKINEEKLKADFEKREEDIKKEMWTKAVKAANEKQEIEIKKRELETKDLLAQVEEMKKKNEESIKQELELRKKTRELEEKSKQAEIENARKLDEERKKMEENFKLQQDKALEDRMLLIAEDYKKREQEQIKQMDILKKSLEEANRKANQGSQQIQWEIQENELKEILQRNFPIDIIDDVPTGIKWADLIHTVMDKFWQKAGIILWESKNTKTWSDDWIKKLRDDRIIAKADVCILVTTTMPDNTKYFTIINEVIVCEFNYFLNLTNLTRDKLIAMNNLSKSLVGKDEKMEQLYSYLSSPEFRSKIENIIDAFKWMKEDLETEKRSMQRIWSKREKELERIIGNTSMLYGDMQWIMGNSLQKISYLELWASSEDEEIKDNSI